MRMFEGWGARLLVENIVEKVTGSLNRAEALALRLREGSSAAGEWELLGQRLAALQCLVHGVDDIVEYQAQLDRVKALGVKPDPNPVLGAQSGWDRTDLMRLARNEIDNAMRLRQLLLSAKGPLLDLAPTPAEETSRRLGPDLAEQLKRKMDIMNAHWEDYKRLFTTPNQ
jgi:bacterioferritin (cytochrome b1)